METTIKDLEELSEQKWSAEFGPKGENGEYMYFPSLRIKGDDGFGKITINVGRGELGTTNKVVQEMTLLFAAAPRMLKLLMSMDNEEVKNIIESLKLQNQKNKGRWKT